MGHHHHHHHTTGNLKLAFFINFLFTLLEIIGAYFTNSMAIFSDAVHDLGDCMALGFAWYFEKMSYREKTEQFTYGYRRFSILAATINASLLLAGSLAVIWLSLPRLFAPEPTHVPGMIGLAVLGILFNGAAFLKTHQGQSHNEKVVSLHLLEDILGWVAILIGSVVMFFYPWYALDTLLSIGIALFILYNAVKNLKTSLDVFLQRAPDMDTEQLRAQISSLEGIEDLHDLHLWSLDGEYHIMTLHLVLGEQVTLADQKRLKKEVRALVRTFHLHHLTIEFETFDEVCEMGC